MLQYEGLERSLEFVEEVWRTKGPFDGIVGFSQGATFTGLLAATGRWKAEGRSCPDAGIRVLLQSLSLVCKPERRKQRLYTEASGRWAWISRLHIVGETDRAIPLLCQTVRRRCLSKNGERSSTWGGHVVLSSMATTSSL